MDKDLLLKARLPEEEIDVPGVGTIRVRALSVFEATVQKKKTDDEHMDGPRLLTLMRNTLSLAMVDPQMTEADIGEWQKVAPAGEVYAVFQKVQELSGMLEGSAKAAYKSDGDEPGAGVRTLPGAEAVDDGGAAAG